MPEVPDCGGIADARFRDPADDVVRRCPAAVVETMYAGLSASRKIAQWFSHSVAEPFADFFRRLQQYFAQIEE